MGCWMTMSLIFGTRSQAGFGGSAPIEVCRATIPSRPGKAEMRFAITPVRRAWAECNRWFRPRTAGCGSVRVTERLLGWMGKRSQGLLDRRTLASRALRRAPTAFFGWVLGPD